MPILIENRQKKVELDTSRLHRSINVILQHLDREGSEVSLLIVDDPGIQKINKEYLGRDYPTNVIAFSQLEGEYGDINPHILGDIVISAETALRDADGESLPLEDELDYLLIHGVLHLIGYDHEATDSEARRMQDMEKELFATLHNYDIE
jgi:probable rRNA maturation factor